MSRGERSFSAGKVRKDWSSWLETNLCHIPHTDAQTNTDTAHSNRCTAQHVSISRQSLTHTRAHTCTLASSSSCCSPCPDGWQWRPPDPSTDLDEGAVPHSCLHCHVGDDGGIRNPALQPHTAGVVTATALRWAGNTEHETVWVSRFFRLRPWLCPTHG